VSFFVPFPFQLLSVLEQPFREILEPGSLEVLDGLVNQFQAMHVPVCFFRVAFVCRVGFVLLHAFGSPLAQLTGFFSTPSFQKSSNLLPQWLSVFSILPLSAKDRLATCIVCACCLYAGQQLHGNGGDHGRFQEWCHDAVLVAGLGRVLVW